MHGWERLARAVMARPWTFIAATLIVIGVLAAPVASARLNVARADVLPAQFDVAPRASTCSTRSSRRPP